MAPSAKPITIPSRKHKELQRVSDSLDSTYSSSSSSSKDFASSYGSFGSGTSSVSTSPLRIGSKMRRRESLMSAAFCETEHTVVNVGDEESMQLITCVKASQGFDWNQEIFLPSNYYANYNLERRPDPVEDIVLTDEEMRKMIPS